MTVLVETLVEIDRGDSGLRFEDSGEMIIETFDAILGIRLSRAEAATLGESLIEWAQRGVVSGPCGFLRDVFAYARETTVLPSSIVKARNPPPPDAGPNWLPDADGLLAGMPRGWRFFEWRRRTAPCEWWQRFADLHDLAGRAMNDRTQPRTPQADDAA